MNERYLFRGKRLDNGEWVTGYYYETPNSYIHVFYQGLGSNCFKVDSATVGQCTGLRDKNETLIFEGDIVSKKCGTLLVRYLKIEGINN